MCEAGSGRHERWLGIWPNRVLNKGDRHRQARQIREEAQPAPEPVPVFKILLWVGTA